MPHNFSFVIPKKLAGMGRLGEGRSLEEDLWYLAQQGVGAIVSLTLSPPDSAALEAAGLECLHLPVMDFAAPRQEQVDAFIAVAERTIEKGSAVAVQCGAGVGRTGTMLACYLVHIGEDAAEAVESVRRIRPGSIETPEQEACVREYARRRRAAEDASP